MLSFKQFLREEQVIIPPNSLRIPREEMPQVQAKDLPHFLTWLGKNGVETKETSIPVTDLKYAQGELHLDKIRELLKKGKEEQLEKPIIVSNDNYVLDGAHRCAAKSHKEPTASMKAFRICLPVHHAIAATHKYSKSFTKSIEEQKE